jgi:hypothetical protein
VATNSGQGRLSAVIHSVTASPHSFFFFPFARRERDNQHGLSPRSLSRPFGPRQRVPTGAANGRPGRGLLGQGRAGTRSRAGGLA